MYRENYSNARWSHSNEAIWRPPTDVYEVDDSIVVVVEIAGLSAGDYDILLSGHILVISGVRRDPAEKLAYQQMEIWHGKFRTQVHLPWALEAAGQTATYEDGFLKVVLPKAQVRRVPLQTASQEKG